ncbi:MAG TPA: alcohol dehydrogenase catalytic domain-containing protein [Bryobacteraceae bacterium]|nr:alcohol dehydrogenase catalytic domain-containing protein [Bryobacteraceae bacterium]
MRALVWKGPGDLGISECVTPAPQPGQVLIRSVAVGLCGTDVHLYEGAFAPAVPPLILGHEVTGIVAKAASGRGSSSFKEGDRVVVNPSIGCGHCRYCLAERPQHCRDRKTIGLAGWDGGLADYFVAPVENVHGIPDAVSWADGACMDSLANAVHALDLVPRRLSETVAVFGCGASGLCFIQLCRLRGAARIVAVDVQDQRLDWARRFGADDVVHAERENVPAAIREFTGGIGADLVIEASGALTAPPACIRSAANGGRVLIFGVYEGLVDGVDFQDQHRREITIFGSSGAPNTFARAVELIASGQAQLAPMVTHRVCLEEVPAFLAAKLVPEGNPNHLKSVVRMTETVV